MNKEKLEILNHTLYRASNKMYCGDSKDMKELCEMGYMKSVGRKSFVPDKYFTVTKKGIDHLRNKTPKNVCLYPNNFKLQAHVYDIEVN